MEATVNLINRLIVITIFSPIFIFPGIAVTLLGLYLGNMYLKSQLSVKRELRYFLFGSVRIMAPDDVFFLSNARSPLLAHVIAANLGAGKLICLFLQHHTIDIILTFASIH